MHRILTCLLLFVLFSLPLLPAADLTLSRNGTILVDGKSLLQVMHYSDKWYPNRQNDANFNLRRWRTAIGEATGSCAAAAQ